jgi:hypothetical protein
MYSEQKKTILLYQYRRIVLAMEYAEYGLFYSITRFLSFNNYNILKGNFNLFLQAV